MSYKNTQKPPVINIISVSKMPMDCKTFCYVAEHGNIEILEWLWENDCDYDESVMCSAACSYCIDSMIWLKEKKFCYNKKNILKRMDYINFIKNFSNDKITQKNKHEETLLWIKNNL